MWMCIFVCICVKVHDSKKATSAAFCVSPHAWKVWRAPL